MTDKVEQIRAEVERLKKCSESAKKEWVDEGYNQNAFAEDCRIKSFNKLLYFIDSMNSCVDYDKLDTMLDDALEKETKESWNERLGKEEPVSEELNKAAEAYIADENNYSHSRIETFKAGAEWQKEKLWKDAQGDDLPEIDREVIALTQPYQDDDEHLKVVCAHRPSKYAKIWNSDLGEEQVIEVECYDKGGWNIPDVKYWLDADLPNMED